MQLSWTARGRCRSFGMTQKLRGAQGSGAARDTQKLETPSARGQFVWPRPVAELRPLTREELDRLEAALEKRVDTKLLAHWVSTSISNAVKLSALSSPSQARDKLKKLASEGRKWVDQVESNPIKGLLEQKALREHKASQKQGLARRSPGTPKED
jgi:hypothetical protein